VESRGGIIAPRASIDRKRAKLSDRQRQLVALPAPPRAGQERLFLDVRKSWRLASEFQLTLQRALNLRAEEGLDFPTHENVINDLREAYASWNRTSDLHRRRRINLEERGRAGFQSDRLLQDAVRWLRRYPPTPRNCATTALGLC